MCGIGIRQRTGYESLLRGAGKLLFEGRRLTDNLRPGSGFPLPGLTIYSV